MLCAQFSHEHGDIMPMTGFWDDKRVVVTGGAGFLGSRVVGVLRGRGVPESRIIAPRSKDCDLRQLDQAERAVAGAHIVIHLAGTVGGIGFNRKFPGRAFYDNATMALHLIEASRQAGVEKFIGIGSACAYPRSAPVPFREEDLWAGYPEETNAAYGLAKKMMLVQSQAYWQEYGFPAVHLILANLYGPRDRFHPEHAHVIPSLIAKAYCAKRDGEPLVAWGTGRATREFLYVEDAAEGIVLAAERYAKPEPVNLGTGVEVSIKDTVELIARLMDFTGEIRWDPSRPDGQPRRALDGSRAEQAFGFRAKTDLETGLRRTIEWFLENTDNLRWRS